MTPSAKASTRTPPSSETVLTWIWLAGAAFASVRVAVGLFRLRRLRQRSEPIEGPVRLSLDPLPATAIAFGLRDPIVLLPRESADWPASRHRLVVLHELAHVRRRDFGTNLVAEIACALYWFNPLVWLGARAMRAEAESAADNEVLESGVRPSDYATELLAMAAALAKRPGRSALIGASSMVQARIEARLARILSPSSRRRGVAFLPALLALGAALTLSAGLAGLRLAPRTQDPQSQPTQPVIDAQKLKIAESLLDRSTLLIGNADAPIKVVSFFDYQCPACRKQSSGVQDLIARTPNAALFLKQLPLPSHNLARPAATLALKAEANGTFPAVHRALLEGPSLSEGTLDRVAKKFGLDPKPTSATEKAIDKDFAKFRNLKLTYVPVFLIVKANSIDVCGWQDVAAHLETTKP